jgi:hypothetical protein
LLGAFPIHNLPSITLTLVLVFALGRPVVAFVAFLLFSGPLLLISGLFYDSGLIF